MKTIKIASILIAFLLISVTYIPVVSAYSGVENNGLTPNVGKVVYFEPPEPKIIENTDSSTIVQIGDVLITLKNDQKQQTAVLESKNLTTGETATINFDYYEKEGKYYTTMISDGQTSKEFVTDYNPFKPIEEQEMKTTSSKSVRAYTYTWDGVIFTDGYGVKYPHPDYASYGINPWDTAYVQGNQLKHTHYSDLWSDFYKTVPVAVAVVAIAASGGISGALDALIGTLLGGLGISGTGALLCDENDCIWGWQANEWHWRLFLIPPGLSYVPKYMRTGPYTLWDDLGIGNP